MGYGFGNSEIKEKYERFDAADASSLDVDMPEINETEENFEDCEIKEISDTDESVNETTEDFEAEETFEDCEKKSDDFYGEVTESQEDEEDNFDDCEIPDEMQPEGAQQGQYVAEVEYEVKGDTTDEQEELVLQQAYDKCDDPEDMQQLSDNINADSDYEVINAEVIETPTESDGEFMERGETDEEYEERKAEYNEKKEADEEALETAEKRREDAEDTQQELDEQKEEIEEKEDIEEKEKTENKIDDESEITEHEEKEDVENKTLQERVDELMEKEDVSAAEVEELRKENVEELDKKRDEKLELDKEFSEKFNKVISLEKGCEEYHTALTEYNDIKDRKEAAAVELQALEDRQDFLDRKSSEITEEIYEKGDEALAASGETVRNAEELNRRFEDEYYSKHPDKKELLEIQNQNSETIDELTEQSDAMKAALDAKMNEMSEYITSNNMGRYESQNDIRYQQMVSEYNSMKAAYEKNGYEISKLETNNELIQDKLSEIQENPTIKDKLSSLFGGMNIFEGTQPTAAEGVSSIDSEAVSENISVDDKLAERFEKFKGKDVKDLTDEERLEFVSISIDNAIEKYGENLSAERIEKIKKSVSFVDTEYVAKNTNAKNPESVLGYYSPNNDEIKINLDPQSRTEDVIATIDHECLHMITQQVDEGTQMPRGVTGVKNLELVNGNVGMNEGITEMYSIRNMKEINRDYVSNSYTDQVAIMKKFESICGEDKLRSAYMKNDVDSLRQEFDKYSGKGSFDFFCNHMDKMHNYLENGRPTSDAEYEKSIVNDMLNKYKEKKENYKKGGIIDGLFS